MGEAFPLCPGEGGGNPPLKNAVLNHSKFSTRFCFFPEVFWVAPTASSKAEVTHRGCAVVPGGIFNVVLLCGCDSWERILSHNGNMQVLSQ